MRRVNQAELEAPLPLPQRPARNPRPLYGQPEVEGALRLLLAGRSPLFVVTPPGFDLPGQLGSFLAEGVRGLPPDPALALVPRGDGLAAVLGAPGGARVLRPEGPPGFRYLPEPD
ncbi:MAG TPA: hypothetical protein ENJ76_01980, partial [Oceanithermus sp.]|nr:hypothetical protein [Oceanithermus sp.]